MYHSQLKACCFRCCRFTFHAILKLHGKKKSFFTQHLEVNNLLDKRLNVLEITVVAPVEYGST